ncbi:MAG: hypothetical protein ABSG73_15470 [Candidatus Aminicenantales bacterium]|jgi:hypothetical protein
MEINPNDLFETELINKTDGEKIVLEYRKEMLRLGPGETKRIHSIAPTTSYARYSRIVFEKDGSVTHKVNAKWTPPPSWEGRWILEIVNEAYEHQTMRINQESVSAYRGVPRLAPVDIDDPLVWVQRLVIKEAVERMQDGCHPGYLKEQRRVISVRELRPRRDLLAIKAQLDKLVEAKVMRPFALPPDVRAILQGD